MNINKSSYMNNIDYSDIFKTICFLQKNPKKIIEIGILEGYSLKTMADNVSNNCEIVGYDIFEEFNGNCAKKEKLKKIFSEYSNVTINYGDYYKIYETFDNNSIDILHIDIANNGDVYEFALNKYYNKLTKNGIIILEGGSKERDNIDWMIKYNKPKINEVLSKYKTQYNIITIGNIPSITLISKK